MGIYRQFTDGEGQSHIEELNSATFESLMEWTDANAFRYHVHAPGTFLDWHPSSGKNIIVVLSGAIEITVTDGTSLVCKPGDLRMTSDTGKGHTGRVVGNEPCAVLMVHLGDHD
ncbi:MAG: cupin domain-containing protein [Oscillospiraceae bacterium]|jgi:redox-sensitive bicupin YhaK (pirin superfamily)|nr:cupin domain-containing protein [Oscillospiraceae bacterium]